MIHRHINTNQWTLMAIESLFDRGDLADWREFAAAMKLDEKIAADTLHVCSYSNEPGAAAMGRFLVERYHPGVIAHNTSVARG